MLAANNHGNSGRSKAPTPQSEFAALQSAIKRQQKRNQSLQDDLQGLVHYYQERILPQERNLVFPIKLLIERLMGMYPRKALTQWQRQELTDWIFDEIQHLAMLDADAAREMASAFQAVMADFFKLSAEDIAELEAHAEREMQRADEDAEDDDDDPFEELLRRATEQKRQQGQGNLFDDEDEEEPAQQRAAAAKQETAINPENWIKLLFRRAAKVLHPDREQDPVVREQKHHLMSALIDARDRGDIMAMLALFNDHVAGSAVAFSAEEYPALIQLLQRQLNDLQAEERSIAHASPFHAFLHRNLYSKQKPTQERKIKAYLAKIEVEYRERLEQATELRSVKALQSVLKERVGYGFGFDEWF
jgi:hypothetical protein